MTPLRATDISKAYGSEQVLKNLGLKLHEEETLSILGRSGCGKTTLLKILGGITAPDSGRVLIHQTDIQSLRPQDRDAVYLYQEALLFPHLNVFENIAFGLRLRKVEEREVKDRVDQMIGSLGLGGMSDKMPQQLSGGQKQRVSFGRALITNPSVLLLDEPFGNLDAHTRNEMQQLFRTMADSFKITAVFVTHNVKEAIRMGDRIGTLENGALRVYDSADAFIRSGNSSVRDEVNFWSSINPDSN